MTTDSISLFQAMNAKMNYLAARQKVISQNISNANTPNFQGSDIQAPKFDKVLENITHKKAAIGIETTNAGHISPSNNTHYDPKKQRQTFEMSPDRNAINVEEQMVKANDVQMNYNLMLNLYGSNMDMMRTAIGKRG